MLSIMRLLVSVSVLVVVVVAVVAIGVVVLCAKCPSPAAVIELDLICMSILSQLRMRKSMLEASVTNGNRVGISI